ncbi:KIF1-binding protein [Sitophilus oryzae]|uniref:KIF-binding protein n=1 Tax=Sitophilus oryzae TaxID=7048 RepID=A0A6J2XPV8_SITOR|nr:KIF1-binding protein [Sitophilus oryzae]
MIINKETFVDLQEKYEKVIKLLSEGPKSDPENEPYLSKYSARQILVGMKANLENLLRSRESEATAESIHLTAMQATVYYYLGLVAIETDETSTGEKHLEKCKEIIEKHENTPEGILVSLMTYNQFGILWSLRDLDKSKMYLEKADKLYGDFISSNKVPIDIKDLFESNIEVYHVAIAFKNLEKAHTLTLYYLAQIFGKLNEDFKSAIYCHITLQRQLEADDYDPIDWALNSATLSQFFMQKCGFKQARHHLAAASYILEKYKREELVQNSVGNEEFEAALETFNHRSADVARCWTKYGIFLLGKSKDRLLAHTENIDEHCQMTSDLSLMQLTEDTKITREDLQNLSFTGIDVTDLEEEVTDQFVLDFSSAKKVFLKTSDWIKKSQDYYNLDTLASDYIETILDQSQLYLNLLFFEDNPDNQSKLHKRRIDLLEHVINNVNSQYYMSYCRQIWFELGQSYSDIIDIKLDKLRECKDRPKPQALNKINILVEKSIKYYETFIFSFKANISEKEKIIDDGEKAFLRAYFYVAALYGRYITLDKATQLKNTELQYEHYKFIADYCEKHTKAQELIPMELNICKEMILLLPVKILRTKQQLQA